MCHGCKKNQPGLGGGGGGGVCPQQDQAGSDGRTDPRTHASVHSSACTWCLGGLQNPCVAKHISSPATRRDLLLTSGTSLQAGLPPPPAARLVGLKVVVKKTGLGCQSSSFPSCLTWRSTSSLRLMVKTRSWFNSWHPSETSNSRFLLPGRVVPALPPRPGCSAVLPGTATRLPGRLPKS